MKNIIRLLFSLVICWPSFGFSLDTESFILIEKRRHVVKVYEVSEKDQLVVDNQYGEVKVNLWNKNEIKVEVIITASAPSESQVVEYLGSIKIGESRGKNLISLRTTIDKSSFARSGWSALKRKTGEKNFIQIDYTIFMPRENELVVKNQFGDTNIPSFEAPLTIDSKHGNFNANILGNAQNVIYSQFGQVKIGKMEGGNLEFENSDLKLDRVQTLILNSKSGELSIGDVNDLTTNMNYSKAIIGKLRGTGKIRLNYTNNFRMEELTSSEENLDIHAEFSSVTLPAESNSFNVTVTNGDFSYPTNVNFSKQPSHEGKSSNQSRQYQGKIGTGSGAKITVYSNFGDVKLKN
ncbi:hypothetical protein [Dyadobacter sp. LHD-138]|uniref:hypothetical protein n=1 Tax=Dyadobacter sp. LHD-138 TaxID=3071413 RepID=UPI0027E1926F|nr:hypothetical protein [Dyadobacter sp. LHD-138]MDQ6478708.1 hypothetical protein [Dyadobacter sp. LHD-138]